MYEIEKTTLCWATEINDVKSEKTNIALSFCKVARDVGPTIFSQIYYYPFSMGLGIFNILVSLLYKMGVHKCPWTMSEMVKYKGNALLKRPKSGPVFHHLWHSPFLLKTGTLNCNYDGNSCNSTNFQKVREINVCHMKTRQKD